MTLKEQSHTGNNDPFICQASHKGKAGHPSRPLPAPPSAAWLELARTIDRDAARDAGLLFPRSDRDEHEGGPKKIASLLANMQISPRKKFSRPIYRARRQVRSAFPVALARAAPANTAGSQENHAFIGKYANFTAKKFAKMVHQVQARDQVTPRSQFVPHSPPPQVAKSRHGAKLRSRFREDGLKRRALISSEPPMSAAPKFDKPRITRNLRGH